MVDFKHDEISNIEQPGRSTEACIQLNYEELSDGESDQSSVENLIDRWLKRLNADAELIISGGDARRINVRAGHGHRVVPDLVFRGMRRQLENLE